MLQRAYHALVPLAVRRKLRLMRWTPDRRARVRVWKKTEGRVAAGPFAGLRLTDGAPGECEGAVLLGSFESETHEWMEREFKRGWPIAVNVGSNAGFYSTGLAMRLPSATVFAYDIDPAWQEQTRQSAEDNGVGSRVKALGGADIDVLASLPVPLGQGAMVVCDCEGFERELIDPARIPWLALSALCVELHDFAAPGATDVLCDRFRPTHDVLIAEQQPRDAAVWASRAGIDVADAASLCDEERRWGNVPLQGRWLLATPRHLSRAG